MWFHFADKTRGQMTRVILESLQTAFGMTPADVLRSATVTAAELINMPNVSGAIEAGSFGDLIAVEGDPLANVSDLEKITVVMKGGIIMRDAARSQR